MRCLVIALAVAGLLAGCSAGTSSPCAFGSPTRMEHAMACIPYALDAATKDAQQVVNADKVNASSVLTAIDTKVQAGDVQTAAASCGPYLADLVCAGNADAIALKSKLDAMQGKSTPASLPK